MSEKRAHYAVDIQRDATGEPQRLLYREVPATSVYPAVDVEHGGRVDTAPLPARELLAEYADDAWCSSMHYFFNKLTINRDGSVTIPLAYVAALNFQMSRRYEDLLEEEKDLDRVEADKMLRLAAALGA